jgi:hypothetical protein
MLLSIWLTLLLLLPVSHLPDANTTVQQAIPKHMVIAESYLGVVEKTGHNDGPKVEYIIKRGGGAKGASYCAYFVSLCIDSAHVRSPTVRSGLARSFKLKTSIPAKDVMIGKTIVPLGSIIVWQKGETINGHTGFVKKWGKVYGTTIEGNTSSGQTGSQSNGDGIWNRNRKIEPANFFRITAFTIVKY